MPSIRTFRTFLAVVDHGSFAAAGKTIGLTSAAVGLQVRAFEEELGRALFDRGPRSAVLNAAGRRLVSRVRALVGQYEALAADDESADLSGRVLVGALVSALMGAFADSLWSLKQQHPRLEVKLFAGLSADFAQKVERGALDAAVVAEAPHALPASLAWTALYREPMVMIAPRHPHFRMPQKPFDALAQSPFIRFDSDTWTGHLVNRVLAQCGVGVREEMELNSVEAIVELVRQGFGVSIVPRLANVRWPSDRALRVIALPGVDVDRRVGLLERTHHARTRFTAEIKAYFHGAGSRGRRGPPSEETAGSRRRSTC